MKYPTSLFVLIGAAVTTFSHAELPETSIPERICAGQIEYLSRACDVSNPNIKDPKFLRKGEFSKCSDIEKSLVTYGTVASSDSPLGAHKLCSIVEYRKQINFIAAADPSKLQKRSEFFYDFGNRSSKEVVIEDEKDSLIRIAIDKHFVECRIPKDKPTDTSSRTCTQDISDSNRKVAASRVEPLSDEDLNRLRKGEPFKNVVQFFRSKNPVQSTELKPTIKVER